MVTQFSLFDEPPVSPLPVHFDYCKCLDISSGHHSLYPVAPDEIFVHGKCHLPSYPVWRFYRQECEACGRHFSSPEAGLCHACSPETRTWQDIAIEYVMHQKEMLADWRRRIDALV